jgi:hypothetical protein
MKQNQSSSPAGEMFGFVAEELVWYWPEILLAGVPTWLAIRLHSHDGWSWARSGVCWGVVFAALLALALALPITRGQLATMRWRRKLRRACRDCDIPRIRVRRAERIRVGVRLDVRWARGSSFAEVEARAEELAASLRVREVRVERDVANASRGTITLVTRDAFADLGGQQWPLA